MRVSGVGDRWGGVTHLSAQAHISHLYIPIQLTLVDDWYSIGIICAHRVLTYLHFLYSHWMREDSP